MAVSNIIQSPPSTTLTWHRTVLVLMSLPLLQMALAVVRSSRSAVSRLLDRLLTMALPRPVLPSPARQLHFCQSAILINLRSCGRSAAVCGTSRLPTIQLREWLPLRILHHVFTSCFVLLHPYDHLIPGCQYIFLACESRFPLHMRAEYGGLMVAWLQTCILFISLSRALIEAYGLGCLGGKIMGDD